MVKHGFIIGRMVVLGLLAVAGSFAAGQEEDSSTSLMTLGTDDIRTGLERLRLSWLLSENVPDVRLKFAQPSLEQISSLDADTQVRGVEFRLPMTEIWMGYEKPIESDDPRATLSLQRAF